MLKSEFEMKELGQARRILGMEICRDRIKKSLTLTQKSYIEKVLQRFNMNQAKVVSTPIGNHFKLSSTQCPQTEEEIREMDKIPYASAVGSIMYSMVCCRPDLAHAMSCVSRYMANPGKYHWEVVKRLLRYLRGTNGVGLSYSDQHQEKDAVIGYVDSDHGRNLDNRKSLTGMIFTMFGTAVSWKSNIQSVVSVSTTEAEFYAITEGVREVMWLGGMVKELGVEKDCITVFSDNQSAIQLTKHQVFHERSKHIYVKLHFVKDIVKGGAIKVEKIDTEDNPSDILTKAVPQAKFIHCMNIVKCVIVH